MVTDQVVPRLRALLPPQVIRVRSFRIAGMGESDLDTLIAPVYSKYENPVTTVLSAPGDLSVHLRARCATETEACALLKEVGDPIAELLGDRVYTTDPEETLDMVVGRLLRDHQATVATAESCTGGLIASRLTEHAGSSDFFLAGFVTYTDEQKQALLGVSRELLDAHSAVSEPVAAAMAEGALKKTGGRLCNIDHWLRRPRRRHRRNAGRHGLHRHGFTRWRQGDEVTLRPGPAPDSHAGHSNQPGRLAKSAAGQVGSRVDFVRGLCPPHLEYNCLCRAFCGQTPTQESTPDE